MGWPACWAAPAKLAETRSIVTADAATILSAWTFAVEQMLETIWVSDLVHGLAKSCFLGYIIAIIGCWNGMRTHGGTEGVGRATTNTVVYTSVSILVADFILTRLLISVYA